MPARIPNDPLRRITEEINGALDLLGEAADATGIAPADGQRLGSLMEQCVRLCAEREDPASEPVRTIHHFACTGGTLVSKCVASMPNVQLLSEINPFSTIHDEGNRRRFAPTDIITLMKQSTRGVDPGLIADLFLESLRAIHRGSSRQGYRLVLRDHAHSQYCTGSQPLARPSLRSLLSPEFVLRSVVTVRHPLQTYLSMVREGWHRHFQPSSLDEYCRRHLAFLDDHADVPVVRYEDLLEQPQETMGRICEILDLSFSDQFPYLFGGFSISGDSGRKSDVLVSREPKPIPDVMAQEAGASVHCATLLRRLGYD